MPHYHVLVLSNDGDVIRTYAVDAASDVEAVSRLDGAHRNETVEIWNADRMLRRVDGAAQKDPP